MGCNESKHDAVATGNTILRQKQSDNVKSTKDIETVKENLTAENIDVHHAKDVVGHENDVASTVIEERDLDEHQKKDDDHVKVDQNVDDDDHVDAVENDKKGVVDDHDQSKPEEKNGRPENLENAEVKKEEPQKMAPETEVFSPIEEEKNTTPNAEEKQHVVDSPTEELKTV